MGESEKKESQPKEMLAALGKLVILLLGTVILILGLFSYFQSAWLKSVDYDQNLTKAYEICFVLNSVIFDIPCPHISMERYFVSIVIICFALSIVNFLVGCFIDLGQCPLKWGDLAYHVGAAVLVFISGIVYIVSASQINHIVDGDHGTDEYLRGEGINFRTKEKLAAGSLAIIQSVVYGVVAVLIYIS